MFQEPEKLFNINRLPSTVYRPKTSLIAEKWRGAILRGGAKLVVKSVVYRLPSTLGGFPPPEGERGRGPLDDVPVPGPLDDVSRT